MVISLVFILGLGIRVAVSAAVVICVVIIMGIVMSVVNLSSSLILPVALVFSAAVIG